MQQRSTGNEPAKIYWHEEDDDLKFVATGDKLTYIEAFLVAVSANRSCDLL